MSKVEKPSQCTEEDYLWQTQNNSVLETIFLTIEFQIFWYFDFWLTQKELIIPWCMFY